MNTTIKMTAKQTHIYDNGTEPEQMALLAELRDEALRISAETGRTVEVETEDGIVAFVQQ